jgi:sarcosine oxidase
VSREAAVRMEFDTIVIGVGGMGSAVVDALAGCGQRVLGVEQFEIAHARGASHGQTRIVRQAYFESPAYIPLLRRAYELWDQMPAECSLRRVGCLMIGRDDSPVVVGASRSAAQWDVELQALTAAETTARFPQFRLNAGEVALFEPDAGYVRPEATVAHLVQRAVSRGATVLTDTMVRTWEASAAGVRVRTSAGQVVAERLVLAAGGWTPRLAAALRLPIQVERRVMHFWQPRTVGAFEPGVMPTFIWDLASEDSIYGFPRTGRDGVKIGFHNRGGPADLSRPQPDGTPTEVAAMVEVLRDRMPDLGRHLRSIGCTYALTPDHDFVLGRAPGFDDRVVVAAGFSGHGFKFVPVIGEVVADLVTEGETRYDLGFLSPNRFLPAQ